MHTRKSITIPKAFSMLEVMFAIGLFAATTVLSVPAYNNIKRTVGLKNTAAEVVDVLRQAQMRSIASKDMVSHGVHFGTEAYTGFGDSWGAPLYATVHKLPAGTDFSAGAGSTLLFERNSGFTTPTTLQLRSGGRHITINISETGVIDMN